MVGTSVRTFPTCFSGPVGPVHALLKLPAICRVLRMTRTVSACLVLLSMLFGQPSLLAQLPVARLFTVFPPGGKAGAQVEIELTGADLDEASQLHFSDPAITAKQ